MAALRLSLDLFMSSTEPSLVVYKVHNATTSPARFVTVRGGTLAGRAGGSARYQRLEGTFLVT